MIPNHTVSQIEPFAPNEDASRDDSDELTGRSLLELMLATSGKSVESFSEEPQGSSIYLGECLQKEHPDLVGHVLVRWQHARRCMQEKWLLIVADASAQEGDRVVLVKPANSHEPIVMGILSCVRHRHEPKRDAIAPMTMNQHESLKIVDSKGQELLEVSFSSTGPIVRLFHQDTHVEFAGKLRVDAQSIEFKAKEGPMNLTASKDVVVRGDVIRLN